MRSLLLLGLMLLGVMSSGCYYSHLASGQLKLLWAREPIDRVLQDPEIPDDTRSLLSLVHEVRSFAIELGLRVDEQYTSYVAWPDDRIVTTLVRTSPRAVEATPYWFPFVGSLPYKGYFDRSLAEEEADRLRNDEGFDVCVSGVTAYSTLGWMDDPVTSPMLSRGAASLVETLLHELVHATAFVTDDVDFNESVAQFIGQEAAVRFFAAKPNPESDWPDAETVRDSIEDRRAVARTMLAFRERLVALSERSTPAEPSDANSDLAFESERALAEGETRAALAALPLRVIDSEKVAERARLNNACLALRGSYVRDLPRHAGVLSTLDGDLSAMIARLTRVADEEITTAEFYEVEPVEPRPIARALMTDELDDPLIHEAPKDF